MLWFRISIFGFQISQLSELRKLSEIALIFSRDRLDISGNHGLYMPAFDYEGLLIVILEEEIIQ